MYLKELKKRIISISWVTLCIVAGTFPLGCAAVFLLADYIPFMQEMEPLGRLAVAMLAGAILIARSPSSAIAVVNELRARGPGQANLICTNLSWTFAYRKPKSSQVIMRSP